jgi:hypothetical protein
VRGDSAGAIPLYGECNYVTWPGAVDYRKTLPNLKIFYIPHAAHYIQLERPLSDAPVHSRILAGSAGCDPPG